MGVTLDFTVAYPCEPIRGEGILDCLMVHPHPFGKLRAGSSPLHEGEWANWLGVTLDFTVAYPCEPIKGEGILDNCQALLIVISMVLQDASRSCRLVSGG